MSVTGVDLGGAGATMCYVKGGAIDCVLNEASKRKSPSLVSFYQGQRCVPLVSLTPPPAPPPN